MLTGDGDDVFTSTSARQCTSCCRGLGMTFSPTRHADRGLGMTSTRHADGMLGMMCLPARHADRGLGTTCSLQHQRVGARLKDFILAGY